jgi:signal transduction histidine kinase
MDRMRSLWLRVSSWLVPLLILGVGAVDLAQNGSLSSEGAKATFPGPVWVHGVFLLAATVPLVWRKNHPFEVALIVTGACAVWILSMFKWSDQPPIEPALALLVALFALARHSEGWRLRVGTAVCGAVVFAAEIIGGLAGQGVGNVFPALLVFTMSWVLGRVVHNHSRIASVHLARADRLEVQQDILVGKAAERERSRIARELHDVIAHSLSLIVVQAAAERRTLGSEDQSSAAVLATIENTGRQAMAELRRLLGVLRKDDAELRLSPQPGLAQLPALVAQLNATGVEVEVNTAGEIARLPPGIDLSAYRIIQECLTNVVKHACATQAKIDLTCHRRSMEIEVTDNGHGSITDGHRRGYGLIGMRERAAVYEGEVEAGPLPTGGYKVRALLRFDPSELAVR